MPPVYLIALSALAIFVAAFAQGVTGFGFGLVAMSLLPLFGDAREASVLVGIFSLASSASVLASVRSCFRWRDVASPLVGMFLAVPLGVYALTVLDEQVVRKLVAGVVLLACVQVASPRLGRDRPISRWWGLAAGLVGGVLGGAFGIGGPPVIAYASMQDWDSPRYKAMLCSYFSVSNTYRLVLLVAAGLVTRPLLVLGLFTLPGLLLGTLAGIRTFRRLSGDAFRKAVIITLALLAISLLVL